MKFDIISFTHSKGYLTQQDMYGVEYTYQNLGRSITEQILSGGKFVASELKRRPTNILLNRQRTVICIQ